MSHRFAILFAVLAFLVIGGGVYYLGFRPKADIGQIVEAGVPVSKTHVEWLKELSPPQLTEEITEVDGALTVEKVSTIEQEFPGATRTWWYDPTVTLADGTKVPEIANTDNPSQLLRAYQQSFNVGILNTNFIPHAANEPNNIKLILSDATVARGSEVTATLSINKPFLQAGIEILKLVKSGITVASLPIFLPIEENLGTYQVREEGDAEQNRATQLSWKIQVDSGTPSGHYFVQYAALFREGKDTFVDGGHELLTVK